MNNLCLMPARLISARVQRITDIAAPKEQGQLIPNQDQIKEKVLKAMQKPVNGKDSIINPAFMIWC